LREGIFNRPQFSEFSAFSQLKEVPGRLLSAFFHSQLLFAGNNQYDI
jgi:hypothetical protein